MNTAPNKQCGNLYNLKNFPILANFMLFYLLSFEFVSFVACNNRRCICTLLGDHIDIESYRQPITKHHKLAIAVSGISSTRV